MYNTIIVYSSTGPELTPGCLQVAKIHAENAIRQKNQSLNFLRMSARVDATASRVQSAGYLHI